MYQFKIKNQDNGGYRFELGDINILLEGYTIKDDKHLLSNPNKAIAYFNIENNIYGISNEPLNYSSVEEFYEAINQQYLVLTTKNMRRTA